METGQANRREGAGGKPPEEELCVPFSPLLCQVASVINSFVTLWIVAHQAPLSMGFSRKEYWPGLLCPPPRGISNPGIEPISCAGRQVLYYWCHLGSPAYSPPCPQRAMAASGTRWGLGTI